MASAELRQLLDLVTNAPIPPHPQDVEKWREQTDARLSGPLVTGTSGKLGLLGGRKALWIQPGGAIPAHDVLYLHGGAYNVGSVMAYRNFASRFAILLNARVALLDYRLAPEHPFPAAIEDAVAAYRELIAAHVAPGDLAVIGDSAGGGLTAALLVALAEQGIPQPAAATAMSAFCDLTVSADAYRRCADTDPFISEKMLAGAAAAYLAGADPRQPLASPRFADADQLAKVGPLLLQAGEGEVLADDSAMLAERITAAGGDVTLELWPDVTHVWHLMGDGIPEARDAMNRIRDFIVSGWERERAGASANCVETSVGPVREQRR